MGQPSNCLPPQSPGETRARSRRSAGASAFEDCKGELERLRKEVAELREQKEFFRSIVQTAGEGIWRINAESLTDYVNPKMAAMMGYRVEEMLGRPIDDFLDEIGRERLKVMIQRRKSGIAEQFEFEYLRKDGSKLRAFVSANPLHNAGGEYTGAVALLTDIGERKSMEKHLARTADLLERTGSMARVGGWELDLRSGELHWSAATCRIFATPPDFEPTLEDALAFYTPESRATVCAAIDRAIRLLECYDVEVLITNARGQRVWTRSQGSPVVENGQITRLIGTVQDITERKEAEAGYRRELEFNRTLVDNTAAIILLLDREGRVAHANRATVELLGHELRELEGRTLVETGVLRADTAIKLLAELMNGSLASSNATREVTLRAKSGKSLIFSMSCAAMRLPGGEIDRLILTGTDLTELHRLQRELLNISEREQARIGHNLHDGVGQTLTGVASLAGALEAELGGEQKAALGRVLELVQSAIREVRDLSHSMSPAAVKNRGLGGVLTLLADTLRMNHRAECLVRIDEAVRVESGEAENHLYRIAQEACSNAIRHGKATRVCLELVAMEGGEGHLRIDDNGAGMRSERKNASKGIGLQVMDYRAQLIGGRLRVESRRCGGVRVTCVFPLAAKTKPARKRRRHG